MSRSALMAAAILLLCSTTLLYAQFPKIPTSLPKKPTVVYDRVDVKKVTTEKIDVEFIYKIDNPNSFGIDNIFADYELFLKAGSVAVGKDARFKVDANAKSELKLPLSVKWIGVFKNLEELTQAVVTGAKSIPFRIETNFKFDFKLLKFNVPITAKGELPLPEIKLGIPH